MANPEPTNKEIMSVVVGLKDTINSVNEKTDQILEAIGLFSNRVDERLNKLEHQMGALNSSVKN